MAKKKKRKKDLVEVSGGLSIPPSSVSSKKRSKKQKTGAGGSPASTGSSAGSSGGKQNDGNASLSESHGPHFKLPLLEGRITNINDEWQTTKESWEEIKPIVMKYQKKTVWMPFYYDGACADYLRDLGFSKVIHEKKDFFERVKDKAFMKRVDLVLDNPPYTGQDLKERILTALTKANKPFCLLLPSSVIFTKFIRDCLDMPAVQIIVPRKVFVRKAGDNQNAVPFKYLIWLCHKMKLPKDLNFV